MLPNFFKKLFVSKKEQEEERVKVKHQAKEVILKAQEEGLKIKQEAERQAQKTIAEGLEIEKRLARHEQQLQDKESQLQRERTSIEKEKQYLSQTKKDYEEKRESILLKLEKIAQMSKDQARQLLLTGWEDKLKGEVARKIKQSEEEIKQNIDDRAKTLLTDAMRFGAIDYVAEYTLSVIQLPDDEFKGRIIGKDGRNIRAFELATGIDVDLEEEGVIRLSSFDGIKREIARVSLERLIKDGRIQPQRIEEIVRKTREEVEKIIFKEGEELAHKVGVFNLPADIVHALGKFKYRYSTLGFQEDAHLDDGNIWPTSYALKKITSVEVAKIVSLLKKAIS